MVQKAQEEAGRDEEEDLLDEEIVIFKRAKMQNKIDDVNEKEKNPEIKKVSSAKSSSSESVIEISAQKFPTKTMKTQLIESSDELESDY